MDINTLTVAGEVILVPVLTFLTMWVRNANDSALRRDRRDDSYIKNLEGRVSLLESRLDKKESEIREIRVELKNRDAEYVRLFQEHATLRAKYEVLQIDHDQLKKNYDTTVAELGSIKETIRLDREKTATLASSTASTIKKP